MFVMMNAARLGVGMQSLGLTEVAYQNAAVYAKERLQMRSLSGPKAPDKLSDRRRPRGHRRHPVARGWYAPRPSTSTTTS